MRIKIKKLFVSIGNFFEAKKQLNGIKQEQLLDILLTIGYDNNNICAYYLFRVLFMFFATTKNTINDIIDPIQEWTF